MSAPESGGETPLFPTASVRWGRCSRSGGLIDRAFPKCILPQRCSFAAPSPLCRSSGIVRRRSATRRYRDSLDRRRIAAVQHQRWPLKTNCCLCTHSCRSRGSRASSSWLTAAAGPQKSLSHGVRILDNHLLPKRSSVQSQVPTTHSHSSHPPTSHSCPRYTLRRLGGKRQPEHASDRCANYRHRSSVKCGH